PDACAGRDVDGKGEQGWLRSPTARAVGYTLSPALRAEVSDGSLTRDTSRRVHSIDLRRQSSLQWRG
ncbi:MAG: hypothetical protein ACRD3D_05120, partial [Terriglobia bacterium]